MRLHPPLQRSYTNDGESMRLKLSSWKEDSFDLGFHHLCMNKLQQECSVSCEHWLCCMNSSAVTGTMVIQLISLGLCHVWDVIRQGKRLPKKSWFSIYDYWTYKIVKECVAVLIGLYKKNGAVSRVGIIFYTLHQKKVAFSSSIFPGDPRLGSVTLAQDHQSGSVTQGHEGKWRD